MFKIIGFEMPALTAVYAAAAGTIAGCISLYRKRER